MVLTLRIFKIVTDSFFSSMKCYIICWPSIVERSTRIMSRKTKVSDALSWMDRDAGGKRHVSWGIVCPKLSKIFILIMINKKTSSPFFFFFFLQIWYLTCNLYFSTHLFLYLQLKSKCQIHIFKTLLCTVLHKQTSPVSGGLGSLLDF